MIRYKSEEQKLQFKSLCTLIDFKYEYPGYDGKIRYGLYSALPTHCLQALFSDILAQIAPYLELDEGYMDARKEYRKNEKKFQYRNSVDNQFSTDDAFEEHHPEVATESFEDDFLRKYDYKKLPVALSCLSDIQHRRVEKHFFGGMTVRKIAAEEMIDHAAVVRSIQAALKKMKKYYE